MSGSSPDMKAARAARLLALSAALACAAPLAACEGGRRPDPVTLRLTRGGGAAVSGEDVELRFENPPGGIVQLRTDEEGRVRVPAKYAGLRFQVGTDCAGPGRCRRYHAPARLEGDGQAVELSGGLNYP
jgi:hypothetical protein